MEVLLLSSSFFTDKKTGREKLRKLSEGYFPSGPVVRNLPSNAGYSGFFPGGGTKIPPAEGQLSQAQLLSLPIKAKTQHSHKKTKNSFLKKGNCQRSSANKTVPRQQVL